MAGLLYLEDQGLGFTGKALETISGGQIVKVVSGATVLTSTNFLGDIVEIALADAAADTYRAAGVAISTGVSGDRIGVATTGIHGFYAAAGIEAGSIVQVASAVTSADAVTTFGAAADSGAILRWGRALTEGASGQLVAVMISPA
jgi:hypothetical protein